jgi:cytochrome P450 PksS
LFRRWPKLALAVDEKKIKWRQRPGLKAVDHLPVTIAHKGASQAGERRA